MATEAIVHEPPDTPEARAHARLVDAARAAALRVSGPADVSPTTHCRIMRALFACFDGEIAADDLRRIIEWNGGAW